MQYAIGVDGRVFDANFLESSNGPYRCVECDGVVVPKKGPVMAHHFAHKSEPSECNYYTMGNATAESRKHILSKNLLFQMLTKSGHKSYIERHFGDVIGDVVTERRGKRIGFEIQISPIPIRDIIRRVESYHDKDMPLLWLFANPPEVTPSTIRVERDQGKLRGKTFIEFFRPEWQRYIASVQGNTMFFIDLDLNRDEAKLLRYRYEEIPSKETGRVFFICDVKYDKSTQSWIPNPEIDLSILDSRKKVSKGHPYGAWPLIPRRYVIGDTVRLGDTNGRESLRPLNPYQGEFLDAMFDFSDQPRAGYYKRGL